MRSCIKCLFVICVVFIISGTSINPPQSLLLHYFSNSLFRQVFLDRFPCFFKVTNLSMILSISYFRVFQHNIKLRSYSSACYSNLVLLSIFSYLPLWKFLLCFYFYLLILLCFQHVFDYDHCYPMVNLF